MTIIILVNYITVHECILSNEVNKYTMTIYSEMSFTFGCFFFWFFYLREKFRRKKTNKTKRNAEQIVQ